MSVSGGSASRLSRGTNLSFRFKLTLVFMLLVSVFTGLALYVAQVAEQIAYKQNLNEEFEKRLAELLAPEKARQDFVAEQCRNLVHSVRIRAALEEQDPGDLYANAKIELRDILQDDSQPPSPASVPKAIYCRFLKPDGSLIPSPDGQKQPWEVRLEQLHIGAGPQQVGYLPITQADGSVDVIEFITTAIVDPDGTHLASLVLGFKPTDMGSKAGSELSTGMWIDGQLFMPGMSAADQGVLAGQMGKMVQGTAPTNDSFEIKVGSVPNLLFYEVLNPHSKFPPAYEVCVYSLADSLVEQERVGWKILGIAAVVFILGLVGSQVFSAYLAKSYKALETLSDKLSRYLAPQVYQSISEGRRDALIQSSRKKLTIFFSDIVGFTKQTEGMEPEDLTYILNGYLNKMDQIVQLHGGTFDKFMGDAVLVFFGDPETRGTKQDAISCVEMALAMGEALARLCEEWEERGISKGFKIRMGMTSGYSTVGNFGSEGHMAYTIIGNQVNLASRLQSSANPGEIVILHETWLLVREEFECTPREPIHVKGVDRPVLTHLVHGRRGKKPIPKIEERRDGFSLVVEPTQLVGEDRIAAIAKLQEALKELQ